MRSAETEPNIAVYITLEEDWPTNLQLVIHNTGRAEAREIRWVFKTDPAALAATLRERCVLVLPEFSMVNNGLPLLAPGQKIVSSFAVASQVFDPHLQPIELEATYRYGRNHTGHASFVLSVEPYFGLRWRHEVSPADSLEKIANVFESIKAPRHQTPNNIIHVATISEWKLLRATMGAFGYTVIPTVRVRELLRRLRNPRR